MITAYIKSNWLITWNSGQFIRYQTGWFTVRRRNPEAENELNERQEQPQQTEAIPRDPGTEGNTEQAEGSQVTSRRLVSVVLRDEFFLVVATEAWCTHLLRYP